MRLAFVLRHRRRLLMQFDPLRGSQLSSSSSSLKRTLAQQATARKIPRIEGTENSPSAFSSTNRVTTQGSSSVFSPEFKMPTSSSSHINSTTKGRGGSFSRPVRAAPPAFGGSKSKGRGKSSGSRLPVLEGPFHDSDHITAHHEQEYPNLKSLRPIDIQNPKSALSNFQNNAFGTLPQYKFVEGVLNGRHIWRWVLYKQHLVYKLNCE